jgi:hypothetical protein
MPVDEKDIYQQTCANIRATDETSLKLLGLVPAIAGGSALALLLGDEAKPAAEFVTALALFGALVTLGIFRWDLRNIQECAWWRERALALESCIHSGLPQVRAFPLAPRGIGKTRAAKMIYTVSVLGWLLMPWIVGGSFPTPWLTLYAIAGTFIALLTALSAGESLQAEHSTESDRLVTINKLITKLENDGNVPALMQLLAPPFAFRNRNGQIVDKSGFDPKPGAREVVFNTIQVLGDRAVVMCVITEAGEATHNIRLFTRISGDWKLLGWANEPC